MLLLFLLSKLFVRLYSYVLYMIHAIKNSASTHFFRLNSSVLIVFMANLVKVATHGKFLPTL